MEAARDLLIQIGEAHALYLQLSYNYWIQHALFTWQWWFLLLILVIPWYFWWLMVDKRRLLEIWCYGAMTFIAVQAADTAGVANALWMYPIRLLPKSPHMLSIDITILPIIFMQIYQSYSQWKAFIIASFIMAACLAFIAEPILVWMGIYELLNWKYYYSFPIYILITVTLKCIMETIKSLQQKNAT
ncbi:hypothetical protein SOV_12040 [Sporomusa ovata DSM 2662]|uniref:Uncharacterized protein n=2 Tax=Sporomusa ovata TaxID=2378 RepID=A0A0U1KXT6_9FIRM|nr:CBO0543 family protein [Sporomusa ovata]EQB28816.1 hypothetical protein SOV_1c05420 [Sporomusa ovata DSM 2662]CQR72241.1 hypothetical protein SpAn4DRAFT_2701 [Sporomusa ovata]